jgi:hypothetical protein
MSYFYQGQNFDQHLVFVKNVINVKCIMTIKHGELQSHFQQKLFVDQNISGISISVWSNESCAGDCGHEYPYCVATTHLTSIAFSRNIMHQSKFNTGIFPLRHSLSYHVVKSLGINISIMLHTVLTFSHIFHRNYMVFNILFRGIFISVFINKSEVECVGTNTDTLPPYYIQL